MLQLNIQELIKFPFSDKEWLRKSGLLMILMVSVGGLVTLLSFFVSLTGSLFEADQTGATDFDLFSGYLLFSLVPYMMMFLLSIITIPVRIYLKGYEMEILENVVHNRGLVLPTHKDWKRKFHLWWDYFVVSLPYLFIQFIMTLVLLAPTIFIVILDEQGSASGALLGIGILLFLVWFFVFFATIIASHFVFIPSGVYIYLKTGSVREAFNWAALKKVVRAGWKDMLKAFGVFYGLSIIIGMATLILWFCMLGWLVAPASEVVLVLYRAYLYGEVYKELNDSVSITS